MVAAVTPSGAGATTTSIPVASPFNCAGCPLTVILVAGVTLRWTAVILSLVSAAGAGVLFFFDLPAASVETVTARRRQSVVAIERIFTALFQPRSTARSKENLPGAALGREPQLFVDCY